MGTGRALKDARLLSFAFFQMSRDLLIGQLRQGNTAAEILEILETLCSEVDAAADPQPTADPIQF